MTNYMKLASDYLVNTSPAIRVKVHGRRSDDNETRVAYNTDMFDLSVYCYLCVMAAKQARNRYLSLIAE